MADMTLAEKRRRLSRRLPLPIQFALRKYRQRVEELAVLANPDRPSQAEPMLERDAQSAVQKAHDALVNAIKLNLRDEGAE